MVDALRGVGSKGSLDAVLRSASEPVALEGDTLVIGFFHEFHKNWIDNPKYRHSGRKEGKRGVRRPLSDPLRPCQ